MYNTLIFGALLCVSLVLPQHIASGLPTSSGFPFSSHFIEAVRGLRSDVICDVNRCRHVSDDDIVACLRTSCTTEHHRASIAHHTKHHVITDHVTPSTCVRELCRHRRGVTLQQCALDRCMTSLIGYQSSSRLDDSALMDDESVDDVVLPPTFAVDKPRPSEMLPVADTDSLRVTCVNACLSFADKNGLSADRCVQRMCPNAHAQVAGSGSGHVVLAKRWGSRVCMETHCRAMEQQIDDYVTCGMTYCG